jgi:hypothetical protein
MYFKTLFLKHKTGIYLYIIKKKNQCWSQKFFIIKLLGFFFFFF